MLPQQIDTKISSGTAQATQLLLRPHNIVWKHSGLHMMQAGQPTKKKLQAIYNNNSKQAPTTDATA